MFAVTHRACHFTIREAVARLGRAATAFLTLEVDASLPFGDLRAQELRFSALRVLALMDEDDGEAKLVAELGAGIDRAIRTLETIDIRELDASSRATLAAAVAEVHADLSAQADDEVVRALLDSTPVGSQLAELVFRTDPQLLDPDAQVSFCQAAQRLESATHARLGAGLVAFAGGSPRRTEYWVDDDANELVDVRASELASALAWSGNKARGALESARVMSGELATTADAAAAGTLQPAVMQVIADGAHLLTAGIDDALTQARDALRLDTDSGPDIADRIWELTNERQELVAKYDASVSAFASTHTVAETRRKVRDTLARLDPAGFEARRVKARMLQAGVEFKALPDAMAMITAVMPSEQAAACFSAVDAVARDAKRSDPELPVGVRRADALYAFCAHADATVGSPGEGLEADPRPGTRVDAHVDLVMTLDAFLGLSDTPAECLGAGPVPAQAAREFLSQAALVTFRRVIVDGASGHAIDAGAKRYRLTEAERDFILLRDRTCRHPGCNQPARRCEVDHATPYDEGGATRSDNLGALCTRHHLEKTHAGWSIEDGESDGSCTFVSPLGRRYSHAPEALLPWAWPEGGDAPPE